MNIQLSGLFLQNCYIFWFLPYLLKTAPQCYLKGCLLGLEVSVTTQLCLSLCHTMGCSLLASSVHRILQEILEWVAILFSRGSS